MKSTRKYTKSKVNQAPVSPWIVKLQQAAQQVGVTLRDHDWRGCKAKYTFACDHGHEWTRSLFDIGTRGVPPCPTCRNASKLEVLRQAALQVGTECLDTEWRGCRVDYHFRCNQGHQWQRSVENCRKHSMACPYCVRAIWAEGKVRKDGLKQLRRAARDHGGECLSDTYLGGHEKYRFRCAKGHEWSAAGMSVLRGHWCLKCGIARTRLGIDVAQQEAAARGGLCLSTEYVNSQTKLKWQCARGHVWDGMMKSVRAGHWCRECANIANISNKNSKAGLRYAVSIRHATDVAQTPEDTKALRRRAEGR